MSATPANQNKPLFPLGQIVSPPAVLEHFQLNDVSPWYYPERHVTGDFGDLDEADKAENRLSIERGFRALSAYRIAGEPVWIITEAD